MKQPTEHEQKWLQVIWKTAVYRSFPNFRRWDRACGGPVGGELAGIRTQDPRLKRALLYQLSYELVKAAISKLTQAAICRLWTPRSRKRALVEAGFRAILTAFWPRFLTPSLG